MTSLAIRTKAWADEVDRTPPQIISTEHGEYVVEAIGPVRFASDREIWERQHDEGDRHWQMFRLYRDLVPWERTKKAVARAMGLTTDNDTTETILQPATKYRWDERVIAFDMSEDKRMREELHQRRLSARIQTAHVGRQMREKALEAITILDAVVYKSIKNVETGETERVLKSNLSPSDIVRLADVGVRLERLALGEDDINIPPGSTFNLTQINTQFVGMSDEELVADARKVIEAGTGHIRTTIVDGLPDLDEA